MQEREEFARGGNPASAREAFVHEQNERIRDLTARADEARRAGDDETARDLRLEAERIGRDIDRTDALEAYRRLSGEAEARMVQKRLAMTPEERAARPPWLDFDVPEDDQIVRGTDGGGSAHAVRRSEYERWNAILDDYEAGNVGPRASITIMERTPAVLKRIGANDRPITMRGGILQKIVGEIETASGERHGIPVSQLRNIQIELDNPIAVFDSAT